MASEYDRKFEDMKKYIPFLESMIERLESNSSTSNPRQAQLDKIRSLRDLLLDQKKRMKMDNLLKCEQVLVNLYAKVEHSKDTIPLTKIKESDSRVTGSSDLETVRNKLKTVAKSQKMSDTLPEIARASEREEICEPGSKEPALFQRRPNRSLSPVNRTPRKMHASKNLSPKSKRYTRVLVSPERRHWSPSQDSSAEKQLFSRRSPRRNSPTYHKKEKKKSTKSRDRKSSNENLNITLKVPEESLHSLNTDDILSRIITCSDGDVDITTLRELRTQILGELKQTGKNDDISELILKSYSKKTKPRKKKKHEVEEGELSDSESEVIDSVYGNLVVMDKDKKPSKSTEKGIQRKIQICLVVADNGSESKETEMDLNETGVFQNQDDFNLEPNATECPIKEKEIDLTKVNNDFCLDSPFKNDEKEISQANALVDVLTKDSKIDPIINISKPDSVLSTSENIKTAPSPVILKDSPNAKVNTEDINYSPSKVPESSQTNQNEIEPSDPTNNVANFYKAQPEEVIKTQFESNDDEVTSETSNKPLTQCLEPETTNTEDTEIPLLNEPHLPPKAKKDVLSEIDILQALKNEILSETIPITPTEGDTPALHQPKLTKVASGTEVSSTTLQHKAPASVPIIKKRISIENYKKKSESAVKSLFTKKRSNAERDEIKKQSLKLTEKECERFNLPRLSLDDDEEDISDDDLLDDDKPISVADIYADLAPKSPDQEQFCDDFDNPVLIPTDPIKSPIVSFTADVDMRSLGSPKPVPAVTGTTLPDVTLPTVRSTAIPESKHLVPEENKKPLTDPRLRRDNVLISKESPKTSVLEESRSTNHPNIPLLGMTPVYTPSYAPSMTPIRTPNARSYEMTPTHQSFEIGETRQKHVYAPSFFSDNQDKDAPPKKDQLVWVTNDDDHKSHRDSAVPHWEIRDSSKVTTQREPSYNPRNDKFFMTRRESYSKQDSPSTPGPSFGWSDGSSNTGRLEAPLTLNHAFGRSDRPSTPIHPFGRSDCPSTPIHPFGRADCPSTPIHPFGRSDCPSTPAHSFGRSDCPKTPSHPFGRTDYKDPRLNRRPSDFESSSHNDEIERGYHNDRNYRNERGYHNQNNSYRSRRVDSRKYEREYHGRSDRYSKDHNRYSNIHDQPRSFEREKSIGRSDQSFSDNFSGHYENQRNEGNQRYYRDDNNQLYSRDRDRHYDGSRRNQRERSIGRSMPDPCRTSRARSVGRKDESSLTVKPHVGHEFSIDTSVNATFQKFLESGKGIQIFDYSTDARRQRATSVGRSLHREKSVERSIDTKKAVPTFMDRSKRASSVGRSLKTDQNVKTFTEIKADFKTYKFDSSKFNKNDNFFEHQINTKSLKDTTQSKITKSDAYPSTGRKKDEVIEVNQNFKQQYSPRKNYRDPRMRRDLKDDKSRHDKVSRYSIDRRQSGIVYSSDNIAKGTIMGSGFGVSNYKIPKIKRSEPERPKTPVVEEPVKENEQPTGSVAIATDTDNINTQSEKAETKSDDEDSLGKTSSKKRSGKTTRDKKFKNTDDTSKVKNKLIKDKANEKEISSDDDSDVRVTRSSKRINSAKKGKYFTKTRRIRKIINDSDSDELEVETKPENIKNKKIRAEELTNTAQLITKISAMTKPTNNFVEPVIDESSDSYITKKNTIESITDKALRKTLEDSFDSSFGIDDLEMFSENIEADPVINSISDLIADLDKDLNAPKSTDGGNFNTEMDTLMRNLNNQEENSLGDISELIEKDLNESSSKSNQPLNDSITIRNETESTHNTKNKLIPIVAATDNQDNQGSSEIIPTQKEDTMASKTISKSLSDVKNVSETLHNIDETVSTTQGKNGPEQIKNIEYSNDIDKGKQVISDSVQLAPDSTIVQCSDIPNKPDESLPDSTMEIHSEVSSDVTSTLNDTDKPLIGTIDHSTSQNDNVSTIDSFGSLLSILQDKSKIKELLSMLGDKSVESEKIKKKLEKFSEIVSDDEDAKADEQKEDKLKPNTQVSSHSIPITEQKDEQHYIDLKSSEKENLKEKDNKTMELNSNEVVPSEKNYIKETDNVISMAETESPGNETSQTSKDNDDEIIETDKNCGQVIKTVPSPKPAKKVKGTGKKIKPKGKNKKGKFAKVNTFSKKRGIVKKKEIKPKIQKGKRANRELQTLQNDLKEMFMCNDVLNANGLRNCRLKKLIDSKTENIVQPEEKSVLEKSKDPENFEEPVKKLKRKPGPKQKVKNTELETFFDKTKDEKVNKPKPNKPGPKSKTKQKPEKDCYDFDSDSLADTNTSNAKESEMNSSDSESESGMSSSSENSEVLADIKKKPKKKRGVWQTGIIKAKLKKKKESNTSDITKIALPIQRTIPDLDCFIDKNYCFRRGLVSYDCRLCHYSGTEIVSHYKKQHAHTEVPLSRMDPETARKAIQQCEQVNFQAISKIPTEKYTCRFCYKEFSKNKVALENFFWHVVSTHTGEYKHLCYECVNVTRCPFNLDIPPPPKEIKGQLIGYICGKCNFTQISLENLKKHVIERHNDEQTEVYTINLNMMSQKAMKAMLRKSLGADLTDKARTLRSSRSNVSIEDSDDRSEISGSIAISEISSILKTEEPDTEAVEPPPVLKHKAKPGPLKSKLRFETEEQDPTEDTTIKHEELDMDSDTPQMDETFNDTSALEATDQNDETIEASASVPELSVPTENTPEPTVTSDIFEKPHFKLNYKESGAKEYLCCVNGQENHYKTTLLISLKKHVQSKHPENWDGYCCVCKVIVTLQGVQSSFKDCLTHFLDRHIDDFPVMEKVVESTNDSTSRLRSSIDASTVERTESPRAYIAVRPLSDLISKNIDRPLIEPSEKPFPVIESIVSLGNEETTVEPPQTSPVYPSTSAEDQPQPVKPFLYEEVQAEVMSKKHRIVLDTMMPKDVLVRVFKCAGHFCSFTTDSAEDALVHASAHKQLGGEGALDCAYCNFDAADNAIDLVMHVFKEHGRCHFSCSLCFYRAAADQLVGSHYMKAHWTGTGRTVKVLRTTNSLGPVGADTTGMLSRETVVPYYTCYHGNGACKFKTYTPGKYCEHLEQKHETEDSHPCNLCEVVAPSGGELVKHLKEHGLKMYQCTWCIFGANTEAEMLTHASALHPTKNPQAYLRIITNKDGSSDLRVLPLVYLNKLKVPIEHVTPSKVTENATKEAERSIELEKLIRHTSLTIESTRTIPEDNPVVTPEIIDAPAELTAEPVDITDVETAIQKSILSSPQKDKELKDAFPILPVKKEIDKANQVTEHFVYCLDSDEEDRPTTNPVEQAPKEAGESPASGSGTPKETVIDLSDDELEPNTSTIPETPENDVPFVKISAAKVFTCPECFKVLRSGGGLRRHTNLCCPRRPSYRCPHKPCPMIVNDTLQLLNHFNKSHLSNKQYYCGMCKSRWSTLSATKKHLKENHTITNFSISSQVGPDGTCTFFINQTEKADKPTRKAQKQPSNKTSVETPKKYGINDIDKLPLNPILESLVYCDSCEFSTKVRLNLVRHLLQHAESQPVPHTAPVNPVPHLETNEMHFDRMVNLASSSVATRPEARPTFLPEVAARFPKYVPDRERYTCGAKGCSYISVDEAMLRAHWNTLHSGTADYHCAHCPPNQQLDTSKSLTANRIMSHLKMHDAKLYACSTCPYYHHRKDIVENHIKDVHKDKGSLQVVREDGMSSTPGLAAPAGGGGPAVGAVGAVGTMDLKPWQCGLCPFKSMLRQSVVEHCSKQHQTKMQYKCSYCPFRTSGIENISKHQSNSHSDRPQDVFYYYYREGTVPDEEGIPRWQIQRQKTGVQDPVKFEVEPEPTPSQPLTKTVPIDLNLVKKEVVEETELTLEELIRKFGQFCEPNGISYKCPLCKTVSEYTREAMQSHLYEELKYRRWSCGICPYRAFHRPGLNDHMSLEHSRNFLEPTELPVNKNIEKWVSELLNHQSFAIEKKKANPLMSDQSKTRLRDVERPSSILLTQAGPSSVTPVAKPAEPPLDPVSETTLVEAFGILGAPKDNSYCCPKCNTTIKDESEMRNHLEIELTKIRWCCTICTDKFSTFHEAQFHCKSHAGPLTRPREAARDPALRAAWLAAVIRTQNKSMTPGTPQQTIDLSDAVDNSLLIPTYEETITADELIRHAALKTPTKETRKRPASDSDSDSDDGMVIHEPELKRTNSRSCPYCDFVSRSSQFKMCMKEHILRHYNLRSLTCVYCPFTATRNLMKTHLAMEHPDKTPTYKSTEIPNCLPSQYNLKNTKKEDLIPKRVCLHCETSVAVDELSTHRHGDIVPFFGTRGDVVVKCCICLTLRPTLEAMKSHYIEVHSDITKLNYAYYKLQIDRREVQACGICHRRFTFIRDLRIHHSSSHGAHNLSYTTVPYRPDEDDHDSRKRKLDEHTPIKNSVAKKSTTKLPQNTVARKSTTKLPLLVDSDSESDEEFSYYGTKPDTFDMFKNVTTMMPMYNTMVEIDVKKLSGILKIDPKVVVKDIDK